MTIRRIGDARLLRPEKVMNGGAMSQTRGKP